MTLVMTASLLVFGGGLAGWYLRERHFVAPPVSSDLTLDDKNRPTSLTTFVTLPDGKRVLHGEQFTWEWDVGGGCVYTGLVGQRTEYVVGNLRRWSMWNNSDSEPGQPISQGILTKHSDTR